MGTFKDLLSATSKALGAPAPVETLSVIGRHMKKARRLSVAGRGPNAAEMIERDATSFTLGWMCSNRLIDAPKNVDACREARPQGFQIRSSEYSGQIVPEQLPFPFLRGGDGNLCLFGNALDQIFRIAAATQDYPLTDSALPVTNGWIHVRRPGLETRIELDTGDAVYLIDYVRRDPRLDGLTWDEAKKKAGRIFRADQSAARVTTTITLDHILKIAKAITPSPEGGTVHAK